MLALSSQHLLARFHVKNQPEIHCQVESVTNDERILHKVLIKKWIAMRLKHFNIELGAQIFLASSDTSRLRILNLILTNGEMCITDLEHILEFTQTKTSRHLLYLKNSGILTSRKINQWAFYQIKDEVFDIIKLILQFVSRDPVMQHDQQIFKTLYSNRELSLNKLQIKPLSQP
jgi:ArsR family transcriptional regulator, arsenate/arsenite/antimonite-responsive transcriptional repressor